MHLVPLSHIKKEKSYLALTVQILLTENHLSGLLFTPSVKMTLLEDELDYVDLPPGSWSADLGRILSIDRPDVDVISTSKIIIMGKARVDRSIDRPDDKRSYRVTFHETWTRLE